MSKKNYRIDFAANTVTVTKKFLDEAGMAYEVVLADKDPETAKKYAVEAAPTLVIERAGEVVGKVANLSNIRKFIEENRKA